MCGKRPARSAGLLLTYLAHCPPIQYLTRMTEKFETKKSLGQHFLNSDVVPRWLVEAANIETGDTVVEVGPGTGALTRELLAQGATVIALEADKRAIESLQKTFATEIADKQLRVYHHDVREIGLAALGLTDHHFKVVSNIPYYLTGMLFRAFLESPIQPNTLVFLIQKEVAKRITSDLSRDEKESILSLSIKAYGEPKYIKTVGKGHFTPPPKVDSGIIAIDNISRNKFKNFDEKFFFKLLHIGFGQKRKQLLSNLAKGEDPSFEREELEKVFTAMELSHNIRAEDLNIDTWIKLAEKLNHSHKN